MLYMVMLIYLVSLGIIMVKYRGRQTFMVLCGDYARMHEEGRIYAPPNLPVSQYPPERR